MKPHYHSPDRDTRPAAAMSATDCCQTVLIGVFRHQTLVRIERHHTGPYCLGHRTIQSAEEFL